jgi:hypothetical protein
MTSTATVSTPAYLKIFLHSAKFSSCAIGGYLIGTIAVGGEYNVTDVVPICHSNPCGPILEISAAMVRHLIVCEDFLLCIEYQRLNIDR